MTRTTTYNPNDENKSIDKDLFVFSMDFYFVEKAHYGRKRYILDGRKHWLSGNFVLPKP